MFCEECGKKNSQTAKFCADCGHPMKAKKAEKVEKEEKKVEKEEVTNAPEIDVNKYVNEAVKKGKQGVNYAKDFYKKNTKIVLGAGGILALVLIVVLITALSGNKMTCEGDVSYMEYAEMFIEAKYNNDDDVTYLETKMVIDTTDKDFEDELDAEDMDIDEAFEELEDEMEDLIDDFDEEGYDIKVKKSGDNFVVSTTYKGDALEEFLDQMDTKDIKDLEDYFEDYQDLKCEK